MPVTFFPVTSPVRHLRFCVRTTPAAGTCLQLELSKDNSYVSAGKRSQLVVSDVFCFWSSWFKYRFIKIDLVTLGKFYLNFSRVFGDVVDCVNVNPSALT